MCMWVWSFVHLLAHARMSVCSHAGKPELRSEVDIIIADVAEPDSLATMCKQAVIVLNCVGPVSFIPQHVPHL